MSLRTRLGLLVALAALSAAPRAQSLDSLAAVLPDEPAQPLLGLASLMSQVAYPADALAEGVQGTVTVRVEVRADGTPGAAEVLRSPDPRLSDAALAAVRGYTYVPAVRGGHNVASVYTVPVRFAPSEEAVADARAARENPAPVAESPAYTEPVLVGGIEGLQGRVRVPRSTRLRGRSGQVFVVWTVTETGAVEDARVLRDDLNDPAFQAAALEAVRASVFVPGMQDGVPVRPEFSIPVTLRLFPGRAAPDPPPTPRPALGTRPR